MWPAVSAEEVDRQSMCEEAWSRWSTTLGILQSSAWMR
jgi:hypothetical protein